MLNVYRCEKCGTTLISKKELSVAGWELLTAGSVDAAKEKHVPAVKREGKVVKVDVGSVAHPMTAEHLIEWVALETAQGYQVRYLTPNAAPVCAFVLADGDEPTTAYAYCNLHGLWSASV